MAEADKSIEVRDQPTGNIGSLLDHPLVKEFGIPMMKQVFKKEFGIETHEKEITKRAFGRFVYALRDFIQGTWWVIVLLTASMGLVLIALLWLKKLAGV
jgi:hypothetical protein